MTVYSAACVGILRMRSSSRRASFSASAGMPASRDAALELLDLGLLLVALAQLLLDGLELLAQEVLALHLGHLVLGLRLDLAAQLEHFQFLGQDAIELDQLLADRVDLQDFLRLLRLHAGAGGDQVGQLARARSR